MDDETTAPTLWAGPREIKPPPPLQIPKNDNWREKQPAQAPSWAPFSKETEDPNMVVLGKIKVRAPPVNKKVNFFVGKKNKPPIPKALSKNKLCVSITKGSPCPHILCPYTHHFSQIEECKYGANCKFIKRIDMGPLPINHMSTEHERQMYISAHDRKCIKRHTGECVESYILRLQIQIKNNNILVIHIQRHVLIENIEILLTCAKSCGVEKLITKVYTPDNSYSKKQNEEEESDEEWHTTPIRA